VLRILLADDHEVVRHGLRDLITRQPGWDVCGEARDGREAVDQAARLKPDVAVVDMVMPVLDGVEATREIRRVSPSTEVLVFTMHESEDLAAAVAAAGGRGCLLKASAVRSIVTAIETVAAHRPYFSTEASDPRNDVPGRGTPAPAAPALLSPRERDVLRRLAEGQDRREISKTLGISERTVKAHLESAMEKTGAHSVVGLVRYALRHGIATA
jgi:DNA-binding NarL/FixJ family response regulator